jgi:magnesium-transporting ATPase (P-type)
MDIPLAIFGVVMIVVGIIFIKSSINSYKNKEKDTFGLIIRSLITGIGLIPIGIIIIVKAFTE